MFFTEVQSALFDVFAQKIYVSRFEYVIIRFL